MDAVFLKLLNMSIAAGWLVLVVVALRLVLKQSPKYIRCILWGFVGVRLVCPFSFESFLSLIPSGETVSPDMLYSDAPTIHSGIDTLNHLVNPIISQTLAPTVETSVNPLQVITHIAAIIWVVGMVVLALYSVITYVQLRRRVGTAVLLRDNIWQSEAVSSPFILGIFRPRIYLPFKMDEASMDHVLAHENAHLKRRDHWIKPIGFLLLTVYWFNPLIWVAYILLCRDIELACDEKVIKDLGVEDKKAYSNALLSCAVPHRMIAACPLAFGEVGVKARIQNVLNYRKPAFWIMVVALVSCVVVAVCFLTNPKEEISFEELLGHSYRVEDIVYTDGMYSFGYTPETAPAYHLTDDYELMSTDDQNVWMNLGTMTETTLTADNFDQYFRDAGQDDWWPEGVTAQDIRDNNQNAWRVIVSEGPDTVFYYVLQQKNGDTYLTMGYYDTEGQGADSRIRWLFLLKQDDEPLIFSESTPYVSQRCVFMSPLSSIFTDGDSGQRYLISGDGVTIANKITGEVTETFSPVDWAWQPMDDTLWQALFFIPEYAPDISIYENPYMLALSSNYYLFNMDGELWIGEYGSEKAGMWSIYALQSIEEIPQVAMAQADLDRDGEDEFVIVPESEDGMLYTLQVLKADGTHLWSEEMGTPHTVWDSLFLCTLDGEDYLLRYNPSMFQGVCEYHYELFTLENGVETIQQSNTVSFDMTELELLDVEEMTSFAAEINALLANSTLLLSTEGGILEIGPASAQGHMENYNSLFSTLGESILTQPALTRIAQLYTNLYITDVSVYSPSIVQIDSSRLTQVVLLDTEYDGNNPLYEVSFTAEVATAEAIYIFIDSHGTVFGAISPMNVVLSTRTATVDGGRVLTLVAIGTHYEYGSCGVREVQVYDAGTLIQTISVQEADTVEYTECWTPDGVMDIQDMNFDGNEDVALFAMIPNNSIPYYHWLWNSTEGQYQYAFTLNEAKVNEETQEISSWQKEANGVYHTDYYRYDNSGVLQLVRRDVDRGKPLPETYEMANGELVLVA